MRKLLSFLIIFLTLIGCSGQVWAQSGTQQVRIVGDTNAALDGTLAPGTPPANGLAIIGEYESSLPTLSSGESGVLQVDSNGRILISPTGVSIAQGSTTSGQTGSLVMGAATTSAPTDTTGNSYPLSLDTSGNLRVNCTTGCSGSGGTALADEGTFTQGTTDFTPMGGYYSSSVTSLTSGQGGAVQLTPDRMMFVNLGKVGGTTISLGQTTMSASLPVAIASNQSTLNVAGTGTAGTPGTAVLTIQGISGGTAVPISVSSAVPINQTEVGGTTILTGAGATGAGSPRVTVAQDTTTIAGSAPGTAGSPSTNVVSVQGVSSGTPLLANPGTAANWGVGATGSAAPASAQYSGAVSSGNLVGIAEGSATVAINVSTATTTQLVALASGDRILVTSYNFANGTGTADNVTLEYGTGTACATGTTALTGPYGTGADLAGVSQGGGLGPVLVVPSGNALCILTSAAEQVSGSLTYTQTP